MLVLEDLGGEPLDRALGRAARADALPVLAIGIGGSAWPSPPTRPHPQGHQAGERASSTPSAPPSHGLRDCVEVPRAASVAFTPEIIAGNFAYMAPSRPPHEPVDRCSQRSLLSRRYLHEMLTGNLPFDAADPLEVGPLSSSAAGRSSANSCGIFRRRSRHYHEASSKVRRGALSDSRGP